MQTTNQSQQAAGTTPLSMPNLILRLEGAATFAAAVIFYINLQASGWLFAALILAPDLSAIGYLAGPGVGSRVYNAVHTLVGPIVLISLAIIFHSDPGLHIALIWLAHIGIDRALGFGIKYPTVFPDTHLQHV